MKCICNFIAKHNVGISLLGLFSLFVVGESDLHTIIAWFPVPIILLIVGALGARINKSQEDEELS